MYLINNVSDIYFQLIKNKQNGFNHKNNRFKSQQVCFRVFLHLNFYFSKKREILGTCMIGKLGHESGGM